MYSMKEVCIEVGMTYEALKFYCNEGLVPNVKRDDNNHRVFDERSVKWIKDLTCLKKCGMSIQEMKVYLALCLEGCSTIPQRQEIIARKRKALLAQVAELNDCIAYVDWKDQFYKDVLTEKIPYISNLIYLED